MSQAALCQAVCDRLQAVLSLDAATCDLMPDGYPKPSCGELFVAVHPGDSSPDPAEGLAEVFSMYVTVTRRLGYAPKDRQGVEVWRKAAVGLDAVVRRVMTALHLDAGADAVLNAANAYIAAEGAGNGFVEPLRWQHTGRPEPKGPEWFSTDAEAGGRFLNAGSAVEIRFGEAKRIQTVESMV
jgi:hypothetical protein